MKKEHAKDLQLDALRRIQASKGDSVSKMMIQSLIDDRIEELDSVADEGDEVEFE